MKYRQKRRPVMTHIVFSPTARPAKMLLMSRLLAATRTLWNDFWKEQRLKVTIRTLHRLNDHSLRDIGLERDNIGPVVRSRYLDR
jgi:uncharacterized protein YjiS (DUF1127 family)